MSLSAAIVLRANRRQSLRWLGVAAVGSAAGLSQPVWADAYEDYSRALVSDNASAILNLVFRGFDPNTLDTRGRPGLVSALHQDSLKVVDELLKAPKINVNLASRQNETPLMMACIKGHLDLAKRLIKMGADVNREGWAPLHYAASPNGSTPLMLAAQYSSEAVVKLLLEEGADITLRNQRNMTAADFAKLVDRQYMVDLLGKALQKERRTQPSRGGW